MKAYEKSTNTVLDLKNILIYLFDNDQKDISRHINNNLSSKMLIRSKKDVRRRIISWISVTPNSRAKLTSNVWQAGRRVYGKILEAGKDYWSFS